MVFSINCRNTCQIGARLHQFLLSILCPRGTWYANTCLGTCQFDLQSTQLILGSTLVTLRIAQLCFHSLHTIHRKRHIVGQCTAMLHFIGCYLTF